MLPTMSLPILLGLFYAFISVSNGATVSYDFDVGWIVANPDGQLDRSVIAINGQWPAPTIFADVGDTLIVRVQNLLGDQATSLHFHGLFMNGTSHMDGTSLVSQCAIVPGATFTYNFTVQQPGTYWYHSHTKSQYPDGLRGPIVIRDLDSPYKDLYQDEIVLSVSDWFHKPTAEVIKEYDEASVMMLHDPPPDGNLLNDTQDLKILVRPSTTYLVRLVNVGAFTAQVFTIEGHVMRVVEVDGVYTQPAEAASLNIASGQRYSFLLTTKESVASNFALVVDMDTQPFMHTKPSRPRANGWLVYNESADLPSPQSDQALSVFDEMSLIPLDEEPLLTQVDHRIPLVIDMHKEADGFKHWKFNNDAYQAPKVPSLYVALTSGQNATLSTTYGASSQPFVLGHNDVVEITIRNKHMTDHPVHLHGHNYQVLHRSAAKAGKIAVSETTFAKIPMRRDTLVVKDRGSAVIRFRADNPGVWLFHCHMEWHAHSGLVATIIEAPLELQRQARLPDAPSDPSKACDTISPASLESAVDTETTTQAPSREQGGSGLTRLIKSNTITVLILLGCLSACLAAVFHLRSVRHGRNQTRSSGGEDYTLVPVTDKDDPQREACDTSLHRTSID